MDLKKLIYVFCDIHIMQFESVRNAVAFFVFRFDYFTAYFQIELYLNSQKIEW